jgi:hypothetical protein
VPHDVLRELVRLARVPEEGAYNLGAHLAEHANELAPVLGTTAKDLESSAALTDEAIVPRLRARLQSVLARREEERLRGAEEVARVAIERLAASVRWEDGRAHMDERLLFSRDLWATRSKHAVFVGEDFETAARRDLLLIARAALAGFLDTLAWVDRDGLHLRWRGNHGRLKFHPQVLTPSDRARALVIALPAPTRVAETQGVRPSRRPALLHDVLAEIGLP